METSDWPQDEWAWAILWAQRILAPDPDEEPPAPSLPPPVDDAVAVLALEVLAEVIAPPPEPGPELA